MTQTSLFVHLFSFAVGFWWIAYQKEIENSKILKSLIGGAALGFVGLWGLKFSVPGSFPDRLPLLSLATILGATLLLWLQAREQLAQKMSRESVLLLTLSFMYFFSPWQASYRAIGLIFVAPCAIVALICWQKKKIEAGGRVGLLFWAMLVSLVIGVQQIWTSPEGMTAPKSFALGLFSLPSMFHYAAIAAGLVSLSMNLIPFVEWVRESLFGNPNALDHQVLSNDWNPKKALTMALIHVAPLILNWKFQFASYSTMMSYALVWSPIVCEKLAEAIFPDLRSEIPGWNPDVTQAS